jgi:O-antigen/teichoic acid export membrane protein
MVGSMWTAASTLAPYVYTTVISIIAARVLGPDDMGRQSFIAFVVLTVQTVSTSGIGYSIVRHVGDLIGRGDTGKVRSLVTFGWQLAFPASLLAAAALLLVAVGGAEPRAAWLFGAVAVFAGGLNNVPIRVLVGAQKWRSQSTVLLISQGVSLLATVVVLAVGWGITGMLAVTAGVAVLILAWSTRLMRRYVNSTPASDRGLERPVKEDVVKFALANYVPVMLTFVVLQRSEFFFLDHYSGDVQIALYSIAFATMLALRALPVSVRLIVMPSVATLVGAGEFDRIRRGFSRFVRLSILLTVPLTAGALALGPALLDVVYGEQYTGAGNVLLVLAGPLPLIPLSAAVGALLTGYGQIRIPTLISVFAAVVDIVAAFVLVPRLDAIGAAIANDLALAASALPLLPYCHRLIGGIEVSWKHVVRVAVASAAAGLAARLVLVPGDSGVLFISAVLAGIASFALLAWCLKVVPKNDAEWIAGLADGVPGRAARLVSVFAG